MTQSGSLKENAPPLSSTDDQKRIKTLVLSNCKEQFDKKNIPRSTGKKGKSYIKSYMQHLSIMDGLNSWNFSTT
jgi:hypothetical protein